MDPFSAPPLRVKNNINNMIDLYSFNTFKLAVNWWVL